MYLYLFIYLFIFFIYSLIYLFLSQINKLFTFVNMHIASSSYWNMSFGEDAGEVQNDEEGKRTMANIGKNMAFLLKKLHPDAPLVSTQSQ